MVLRRRAITSAFDTEECVLPVPTSELEHSACCAAVGGRIPIGIRIEVFA